MPTEIVRLWLENPLQGDPGQAIPQATEEEARDRRAKLESSLVDFYSAFVPLITKAYIHRDWEALGYAPGADGWDEYCRTLRPDVLIPPETRGQLIKGMHFASMSNRAIAAAVGTSARTVGRETKQLRRDAADGPDAKILSLDGKRRTLPTKLVEPADCPSPWHDQSPDSPVDPCSMCGMPAPVGREREWPAGDPAVPPVVFSATPGGATAEAPDASPRSYAGWRGLAKRAMASVAAQLDALTGEFTDPATFAAQADDQLMDELDKLSRRLHTFVVDVWALRGRWVWMSAEQVGLEWHALGDNDEDRALAATVIDEGKGWDTSCGRSTAGGVVISEVRAVQAYGAKPCQACQEALSS